MEEQAKSLESWLNSWIERINKIYGLGLKPFKLKFMEDEITTVESQYEVWLIKFGEEIAISSNLLHEGDDFVKAVLLFKITENLYKRDKRWKTLREKIEEIEGKNILENMRKVKKMYGGK